MQARNFMILFLYMDFIARHARELKLSPPKSPEFQSCLPASDNRIMVRF
jgi:hypothetical protein